ncbi:hypothetical protein CBR_g45561 [Chara braunii]|uniref:DUF659 domain-containing protein n=1 Tax=Chara braunii TaxID=69332 RepID=A0A388LZ41_CHABU|nr:hypothetical protein CBR_g45561 [Chara braunii]|eukprot:GBG87502.1 hypothetical protein CBR_g45561 [Chara braunii]
MGRGQARVFEDEGDDENLKAKKKSCVYKYVRVGQSLGDRYRGNRMMKCIFCGHEFQGNQFVAGRHFRQGKGYPSVTDEALVDIHYNTDYKLEGRILEQMQRFEELHGPVPAIDPRRDEGGAEEMRGDEERIDVDDVVEEVVRELPPRRDLGKGIVTELGGQQGQFFKNSHVSARTRANVDTNESGSSTGKRRETEKGARPQVTKKRLRQQPITESFSLQWQMEFRKRCLRFVYSQRLAFNIFRSEPWLDVVRHFRDLSGPVKVFWPSENEIADIETVVRTTDDVAADLVEVRASFYATRATFMSDGRKSRDAKPIVNFLAGGSRGVMLIQTINREGERDRAKDVLARWIKVFDDFPPKWVNAICTDSASAYVAAANMLQGPEQRQEHRQITWLPCAVHVCNKMLSDIGCSSAWSKDIIVWGRAVVRFIKEHGAALYIFRKESKQMGLIYPCMTRFASVFSMIERLQGVRSALERTVDGDGWGLDSQGEEELGGPYGSPVERQRPSSHGLRSIEREGAPRSAPSRGAESGCGRGVPGEGPAHVCGALHRLVRGPRQRLEDKLAGSPSQAEGDERDRQGLSAGDGAVLKAGGGGGEDAAAVEEGDHGSVHDEGISAGGRGGLSELGLFGDLGVPPGESESRGDISAGMQDVLRQISALHPDTFSPAMHDELMSSPPEAEGDEDRTPLGETSEERLDRLESRCLMARADLRTQDLARIAAEERQRQLGTFPPASLRIETTAPMDPPTGDRDKT